jgi:hypothetical protein
LKETKKKGFMRLVDFVVDDDVCLRNCFNEEASGAMDSLAFSFAIVHNDLV